MPVLEHVHCHCRLGACSAGPPQAGKLIHSPTYCLLLSPDLPDKETSQCTQEAGSPILQPHLKWQMSKDQPAALSVCRAKSAAPSGQAAQCAVLPDLSPQTMSHAGLGALSTTLPQTVTLIHTHPTRKPDQRTQTTAGPIHTLCVGREPSQQCYLPVLSQPHPPRPPDLRAQAAASPKNRSQQPTPCARGCYQLPRSKTQAEWTGEELSLPK